ncbi:MAG: hypothetical protein AB7S78_12845 [Candidatus Omnitrophota bacterium]
MENYEDELNDVYRSTSVIGYSTSFSVIIYGGIAYYLLSRSADGQPVFDHAEVIRQVFWVVGISILISIGLMRRIVSRNSRKREFTLQEMLKHLQTSSMITFGMCESIGILGLVLTLMTKNINDYYGFGFLSLISFGFYFPKLHHWDQQLKQAVYSFDGIDK